MSDKLSITTKKIQLSDEHTLKWRKMRAVKKIKKISERKVTVIMGENELNGKRRFVADGFSQERECQVMLELSKIAAVEGDGYSGNISPHTSSERFEGVTLGRAALLVYFGMMDVEMLELYLNISERGKYFIERYFNTKEELYFTFSHLVCRSSLLGTDLPRNQSHLSHAVHADNCNLKKNGICTKTPPAYTWRDYSAILYLNENFEGGEFFFSSDEAAKHIQSLVKPKCGRLVGFSAGSENLHGVFGVQRGRRCALGLWFTHNPRYVEEERKLAEQVISEVRVLGTISEQLLRDLEKHVVFDLD